MAGLWSPTECFAAVHTGDCARLGADVVSHSSLYHCIGLAANLPARCDRFRTLPCRGSMEILAYANGCQPSITGR
jgi:hypothetical protein